jgi:hypothetical protein
MSPAAHASGRTFKALAALEFDADHLPSTAVTAVLKRIAASDRVIDGVACLYRPTDIKSICINKVKKASLLNADKIMKNCAKILQDNETPEPKRTVDEGWLQMTSVDNIMDKPNIDGDVFDNMEAIGKKFIVRLFGEGTMASGSVSVDSEHGNIIQYGSDGRAVDVPKMVLLNKGFVKGKNYTKAKESTVWKLISINGDGTAKLQAYSTMGELLDKFREITGPHLAAE